MPTLPQPQSILGGGLCRRECAVAPGGPCGPGAGVQAANAIIAMAVGMVTSLARLYSLTRRLEVRFRGNADVDLSSSKDRF
jgi:hypothetical protein